MSTTNAAYNYPDGATSTPPATTIAGGRTAPRWPKAQSALISPSSSRTFHPLSETALGNGFDCAAPSEAATLEQGLSLGKTPVYMPESSLSSSLEVTGQPMGHVVRWQAALREMLSREDLAENNRRLLGPISKCAACLYIASNMRTCNPGPSPLQHDHGLAILRCNASDVSAELRRLPRRQVDALHSDVRSLVLQFQLSPGATKQGSPMPRRAPTKKVPLLCTHARTPHSTRQVAAPHREPPHTYLQCANSL